MSTIPLAHREVTHAAAPPHLRRWWQRPDPPVYPTVDWEPIPLTVSASHVAPLILAGVDGSGKNQVSVWWMWRLLQAGAQVISLGGRYFSNAELADVAARSGIAVASYGATEALDARINAVDLTRIDFDHIAETAWGVLVGRKIAEIAAQRTTQNRPMVVVFDVDVSVDALPAEQLALTLACWPGLNVHAWFVANSHAPWTQSPSTTVRAVWAAARVRCYFRDYRTYTSVEHAPPFGLDVVHADFLKYLQNGQLIIQKDTDGGCVAVTGPADALERDLIVHRCRETHGKPQSL